MSHCPKSQEYHQKDKKNTNCFYESSWGDFAPYIVATSTGYAGRLPRLWLTGIHYCKCTFAPVFFFDIGLCLTFEMSQDNFDKSVRRHPRSLAAQLTASQPLLIYKNYRSSEESCIVITTGMTTQVFFQCLPCQVKYFRSLFSKHGTYSEKYERKNMALDGLWIDYTENFIELCTMLIVVYFSDIY